MKKAAVIFIYVLISAWIFTQCRQPRPSAESSSDPGAQLFMHYCSRCHLGSGIGGPAPGGGLNAADIRQFSKTPAELETIIANGFGQMPPFKDSLTVNEISNIANYVATQIEARANSNKPQPGDEKYKMSAMPYTFNKYGTKLVASQNIYKPKSSVMKKLILSLICCSALAFATFTPLLSLTQGTTTEGKMMKDKDGSAKMVDGKMMVVKNGLWMAMTSDVTMTNGTKVKTDGTVVMKDGKTKMLKNGECVKPDGMMKKM